ncbi:YihY/virulence factor BrkB family protein [Halorarum halophilum]|uniref:YihY/virulence factor BrkB family protein n=1 Tax=Halorarum halophilum TaxID=2743090 RepID=A0A7D5GGY9_9EURY|nr:YihY/virulence factor BrkB family protein [Halobaculum halophilum]
MWRTVDLLRRVARTTTDLEVTFLAAGVAYYAFASLLPTVILVFLIAAAVGQEQLVTIVVSSSSGLLTDAGQQFVVQAIESGAGRGGATVFSALLAIWGTLKVFRGIDTAFENIYGAVGKSSFVDRLRDSVVVAVSIGASFLLMLVLGSVLVALDLGFGLGILSVLVLPVVLTAAFLPMYYFFPEPRVSVREVLPGAVFAGVGWTLLQAGFQAYIGLQGASGSGPQVYGAIGAVLLLVTWLYLGSLVVLVGVVVNVTLAEGRRPGFDPGAKPQADVGAKRPIGDGNGRGEARARHARDRDGRDRHGKGGAGHARAHMSGEANDEPAPDIAELDRRVAELRAELDDIDERTVEKPALESELKRYVRSRMRRGHARGWGPYLVLLYGVVLTLGAFYWLDGWFAIGAMLVLFLSTLGLYTLFLVVGVGLNLLDVPGKAIDAVRDRR